MGGSALAGEVVEVVSFVVVESQDAGERGED